MTNGEIRDMSLLLPAFVSNSYPFLVHKQTIKYSEIFALLRGNGFVFDTGELDDNSFIDKLQQFPPSESHSLSWCQSRDLFNDRISGLLDADLNSLIFVAEPIGRSQTEINVSFLVIENPRYAFALVAGYFLSIASRTNFSIQHLDQKIHESVIIHTGAPIIVPAPI